MRTLHVLPDRCVLLDAGRALPEGGFVWVDAQHEEVRADPDAFRALVAQLSGATIDDLHLQDAVNLQHPSYFDGTQAYDMLVFRKLAPGEAAPLEEVNRRDRARALQEIVTRPITFFVFDRLLATVRNAHSKTIEQMQARLLAERSARVPANGDRLTDKQRLPTRPDELVLRLLNGMVDRYLDLRQPLTERLERWQRELLDPRRPFSDWQALLDARIELRRLENLCEEQLDALQEMRDAYLDATPEAQQSDAYLVRIADVIEHIRRVLSHAQRLENTIETAVQLHFSATTHRTNQIVRLLTVITAVFAPLTLLAGIWGMNFERIPFAHHPHGFGITVAAMAGLGVLLWLLFWLNRFLSDQPSRTHRRWRVLTARLFGRDPPPR
ncbi:MAG: magnesium transporter CorA family protein [Burkholderiaceae bacterium]|nr:magnesium transporter CorA family protein [Burkholderiaceae bacterium]